MPVTSTNAKQSKDPRPPILRFAPQRTIQSLKAVKMSDKEWEDTPFNRVKMYMDYMDSRKDEYFDGLCSSHLTLTSATLDPKDKNHGLVTFTMTVPRQLCNAGNNLHGGAVATIFDIVTSMAAVPCAREGFWDTGHVTRQLNCTYLRPAPEGLEIVIECETVHLGRSMGQLRGVMKRKSDGAVLYLCSHDKAQVQYRESKL